MDKNQAKQLVQNIFSQAFNQDEYRHFLRNLLNHYEDRNGYYFGNQISEAYREYIDRYWRIGKYVDPNGKQLDLLVVEVKSLAKLEHARSSLRNFAVNRLKQFEKDASLIAFFAKDDRGEDWRFSFVKIEHEAYLGEKGKVKLKQELTPARRYSYLVGVHENNHTASKQLLPLLEMDGVNPRVEEIEKAFSIEKITDEFFDQYKSLYQKLAEHLSRQEWFHQTSTEKRDQKVNRFAKKMLGQIVFLYFLQKKGWLGAAKGRAWGEGSKRFLRERYQQVENAGGNYYHDFLQYLFYEALACKREGQEDSGYYERFQCRVPFLNGGLFEADHDWQNVKILIPNSLFHNNEKTPAGDIGTGILDVFDRYNFTIKEDEPLDKEVAVDPEMLGKVFENMLELTERKTKGAFYTPREIVHYMCQESLIHYLDNRLNDYTTHYQDLGSSQISMFGNTIRSGQLKLTTEYQAIKVQRNDLDLLIRKGRLALENDTRVISTGKETDTYKYQLPESVRSHAKAIDDALADIKVCDPAIGSGAFPVGLLHEIVQARLALAPHSGNQQSVYDLKRHAIAESIYGVDLDPSAIDIARLRLWLSLIVDEEDYGNIAALPNLDYKITQGDSLIGFPEKWDSPAFSKIESLKTEFLDETDLDRKTRLKAEIDCEIQKRLDQSRPEFGYQVDFDYRLMFSEVWRSKGGFDIVIGNPPYVQIQNFSGQLIQKDWEAQRYESFAKTGDIYALFYERGYRLLKERGALAFITSNKWMRTAYGEKLRRFFAEKTQPLILIDFGSFQVFETATVDANVLLFEKSLPNRSFQACQISNAFNRTTPLDIFVKNNSIDLNEMSSGSLVISNKRHYQIKKHIEQIGTPLKQWDLTINYGIKTGLNEAFIISGQKKDELIAADPKSAEIIKPILRGRDIKRYRVDFADLWLIATFPALNLNIDNYPGVRDYLKSFGRKLHQTGEVLEKDEEGNLVKSRKKTGNEWFETQDQISYHTEFSNEMITWGNLALSSQFAIANAGVYINAPSALIAGGDRYLIALLNSEIGDYYIRSLGVTRNGGYFEYKPMFVENLPIVNADHSKRRLIETLVNYILLLTMHDLKLQSIYFQQLIDAMVYELYFPDQLEITGKSVLLHICELISINNMQSDEERLRIIQREFNRLYDPGHPVRNIIETLDSVEVVHTIREALQRR